MGDGTPGERQRALAIGDALREAQPAEGDVVWQRVFGAPPG
jgi:hypothetical protein